MVGQRGVRRWSARWYLVPLLLAVGMLASLALAAAPARTSWVHAAATPVGVDAGTYALDCPAESRTLFAAHRVAYLEAGLAGLAALVLYLCAVTSWTVVLFARNRSGARR